MNHAGQLPTPRNDFFQHVWRKIKGLAARNKQHLFPAQPDFTAREGCIFSTVIENITLAGYTIGGYNKTMH